MEIRPLHEDEAPTLVEELWVPYSEALAEHDAFGGLVDEPKADATEHRRERVRSDDTFDRVAVVDGRFVGYVAGDFREAPPVAVTATPPTSTNSTSVRRTAARASPTRCWPRPNRGPRSAAVSTSRCTSTAATTPRGRCTRIAATT